MTLDVDDIEALLPQTQCQLCEFPGCRPYAEAIAQNTASIDRCLPGGVETLQALASITGQNASPMIEEMKQKSKAPSVALIREAHCIGCTKCITACPVDAIIGGPKAMHTIITDACTGCELCLPPCPTDCIELLPIPDPNEEDKKNRAVKAKQRYEKHVARQQAEQSLARDLSSTGNPTPKGKITETLHCDKTNKLSLIQAALAREKARKSQSAKVSDTLQDPKNKSETWIPPKES